MPLFAWIFTVGPFVPLDFASLQLTPKPNQHLICPKDFCAAQAHAGSPVFEMPVEKLRERFEAVAAAEPRVTPHGEDEPGVQRTWLARSWFFRFPDLITVRFIDLGGGRSTLAAYSRALYGHSDLGKNRQRMERWLENL